MTTPAPKRRISEPLTGDHRFQLLVEGVRDYAIYLLDVRGYVSSWNSGAQRFKGYAADEIIGQHFSRFYTDGDRAAGLPERALRTAAETGKFESEGWRVRKDGSQFWTTAVIQAIHDPDGELIGFAKITRDTTEQRKAQLEVERARDALGHAQKMEAIGRLTGGVAHDFNNLLTIIRTSAELLKRPGLPDERRARYVAAIAETADRATLLTKQLLAFARRQPLEPRLFDVRERIEGMEQIVKATLGASVEVGYEYDAGLGPVHADPTQFETALLNMVINARDAMPAGGRLDIRVRNVDGVPAIRGHREVSGAFVAVSVRDTGMGMQPSVLSRVFEPFFTTKEVNHGTGLGLSQVYGFAKQSGGEIDAHSEPGAGTLFTLYLPNASDRTIEAETVRPSPRAVRAPDASRSVLLVEDNQVVGQFVNNLLVELGQSPTWVGNAQAALATLEREAARFDLVFSDVVMPGMNGVDLANEIRRRWPALRVVLTSGYSHVLAEEGTHGFELLQKPYSMEDLVKVLEAPPQGRGAAG